MNKAEAMTFKYVSRQFLCDYMADFCWPDRTHSAKHINSVCTCVHVYLCMCICACKGV